MSYRKVEKGDRVSEYTLVEKLGQGGFGEVWKAEHAQIPGKFVAIKIPTSLESMDCLKQEAVFQHRLDHPNIVKTIGLNTQNDPPYFIMEYVEGRNLRQLMLEDGILPPPYAIDIAVQVCEALAFAHGKGIVHKDIKPENILVEKKRIDVSNKGKALLHCVKITDLGLGAFPDRRQSEILVSHDARTSGVRIMSGTLFYMAPEQMMPGREVDNRADIYSLGVVLYEMLTGELPLGMDLPSELNPVVSPELDAITKRALSIDRDTRYQTAREMAADLQKAKEAFLIRLVAAGTPALELTPHGHLRRFTPREVPLAGAAPAAPRRRRWVPALEWGLLAFVIALLGVSGWAFYRLHRLSRSRDSSRARIEKTAPAASVGPVVVLCRPEGAEVVLDNRRVGTTPLELPLVTFERHSLSLSREFYATRDLVLEPVTSAGRRFFSLVDRATQKPVAQRECAPGCRLEGIELARQKGKISITTPRVEKARVYIDGELYGPTPLTIDDLEAGVRQFRVMKDGYKELSFLERIEGGASVNKEIALLELGKAEPSESGLIRVQVASDPPGATVYVNAEEKGVTPCALDVPAAAVELRLVKRYYEPRTVVLPAGSTEARYDLSRIRTTVTFDSDPRGAAVYMDNAMIGVTPVAADSVEGGTHTATFVLEGFYDQPLPFEVADRNPVGPVKATLLPVRPGRVAFDCDIRGAEIFLDGKSIGRAPLAPSEVKAGTHRVRVLGIERTITVEPGSDKRIAFVLKEVDMVRVPEGEFRFGVFHRNPGELSVKTEKTGAYYIDRYEVTNEKYALFYAYISQTGDHKKFCHPDEGPRDHKPPCWGEERYKEYNGPNHPVVGVTWFDAYAYAAWAGKRLPTEREWEKAARGTSGGAYPWGNDWNDREVRCNWGDKGLTDGYKLTSPVGAFPGGESPFGCLDMVGNVSEWCADEYAPNSLTRVIRGGNHLLKEQNTTTQRDHDRPHGNSKTVGFRCVTEDRK